MHKVTLDTTRERPILFSGPMVRAILDGRKTKTRRVVNPQPENDGRPLVVARRWPCLNRSGEAVENLWCPYGQPGDRLWVRETFSVDQDWTNRVFYQADGSCYRVGYRDDDELTRSEDDDDQRYRPERWRPSIHMPRWASRITLEVTEVRVERVQDIRHRTADLEAEGVLLPPSELFPHTNRASKLTSRFEKLWDSINSARGYGWDANPWVWVIGFRRQTSEQPTGDTR